MRAPQERTRSSSGKTHRIYEIFHIHTYFGLNEDHPACMDLNLWLATVTRQNSIQFTCLQARAGGELAEAATKNPFSTYARITTIHTFKIYFPSKNNLHDRTHGKIEDETGQVT